MKKIKIQLSIYFIAILLHFILLSLVFGDMDFLFTQLLLGFSSLLFIWRAYKVMNKTQEDLSKFLFAIQFNDYEVQFPESKTDFPQVREGLNKNLKSLKSINQKNDLKFLEVQYVIEHLDYPLLLLRNNKELIIANMRLTELIPAFQQHKNNRIDDLIQKFKKEDAFQFKAQNFKLKDIEYTLYYVDKSNKEKEEIESNAWSNLMQVLTHEVMNSVGTITSLAKTLKEELSSVEIDESLLKAIDRIEARSKNLIAFTDTYRKIDNAKAAQLDWFDLNLTLENELSLFKKANEKISIKLPEANSVFVYADQAQIAQVILNCLLNAKEAVKHCTSPEIECKLSELDQFYQLTIRDNGKGIPNSEKNNIFIPFYSTKENGNGIGLSLSRKLMHLNNCRISLLNSEPGDTVFQLLFPKSE